MSSAADAGPSLTVRPPLQKRSMAAWERILDAGLRVLEERGYDGFTIAAVCERAGVAPRAVYDRVDTKDGLFLAVYERGMSRLVLDENLLTTNGSEPVETIEDAVRTTARIFARNAEFLRAVVLISGVHPEITRRGSDYSQAFGRRFAHVMASLSGLSDARPEALQAGFFALYSTLILRTAYGPKFAMQLGNDEEFIAEMARMLTSYLQS